MKHMILDAKSLQCGDVIFTSNGEAPICARVLGQNLPSPKKGIAEYRVELLDGGEGMTTLSFSHDSPVGVTREDEHVEVDVESLFADLE